MPETTVDLRASAPPLEQAVAVPFETPFERMVRGARTLLTQPRPTGDALVDEGARHVRRGLVMSGVALAVFVVGSIAMGAGWRLAATGTLFTYVLVSAGVLSSSRLARLLALCQAGAFVVGGANLIRATLDFSGPHAAASLVVGVAMLTYSAGVALATLTPASQAWHGAQRAARAVRRKAKSLAEWRGSTDDATPGATR